MYLVDHSITYTPGVLFSTLSHYRRCSERMQHCGDAQSLLNDRSHLFRAGTDTVALWCVHIRRAAVIATRTRLANTKDGERGATVCVHGDLRHDRTTLFAKMESRGEVAAYAWEYMYLPVHGLIEILGCFSLRAHISTDALPVCNIVGRSCERSIVPF